MSSILIKNIKSLVGILPIEKIMLKGAEMASLKTIENAFILLENGVIIDFGENANAPERAEKIVDATNRFVLPSFCDSHTHLVFAASRAEEFVDKIKGLSYEEIAKRGGGILNSAAKLATTDEQKLYDDAQIRLAEINAYGTGAVEIKSGYGLSLAGELKMLRVIKKLKENSKLIIKSTFLGAHALPLTFQNNKVGYLDLLIEKMLPIIAGEGLADFIDIFCEKNYFDLDDMNRILEAGEKYGLRPKVHVNQFNVLGGVAKAVAHHALSVDHLECLEDSDISALKNSQTMPVALPGCSFFLRIPYTDARRIISAGLPLALASDFNPGSTPSGNMQFVQSLACIQMRMLPEEALNAVTINGAFAMNISAEMGSITRGKKSKLLLTKPLENLADISYYFGENKIQQIFN